jgi:DNA-directed RNA polymerase specialized sigma24 family protein
VPDGDGPAWLRALASSDEQEAERALKHWKQLLEPQLIRAARGLMGSEDDAREIVTDALHAMWRYRRRFAAAADEGFNSPWRWLWEAVKRQAATRYRYQNARKRGAGQQAVILEDAELVSPSPESRYLQTLELARFRDRLTPIERVIWDRHQEEDSIKTISEALKETREPLTVKQVRSRLDSILQRFSSLVQLGSS